jgi:hypothetical protein
VPHIEPSLGMSGAVLIIIIVIIIIIINAVDLPLGGSSPYTSTNKSKENKYM